MVYYVLYCLHISNPLGENMENKIIIDRKWIIKEYDRPYYKFDDDYDTVHCALCDKKLEPDLEAYYLDKDNDQAYCSEECLSAHEAEGLSRAED